MATPPTAPVETGEGTRHGEKVRSQPSVTLTEAETKFLAFQVVEEAQKQVLFRIGWILGVVALVLTGLGVKTYFDLTQGITTATKDHIAEAKLANENAIRAFEMQAKRSLARIDAAEDRVISKAATAELAIAKTTTVQGIGENTILPRVRVRPIGPGLSVSTMKTSASTLCCMVRDVEGKIYAVMTGFGLQNGDIVIQPGTFDGGESVDKIGEIVKSDGYFALAVLDQGVGYYTRIPEIGLLTGVGSVQRGEIVRKFGRTTGLTQARVSGEETLKFPRLDSVSAYRMVPVVGDEEVGAGGDAGSPVVSARNELLGMYIAGNRGGEEVGFFVPVKHILTEWGLTVVTGS